MMYENDEASSAGVAGAIASEGGEIWERAKVGRRGEFSFLDDGY